MNNKIILSLLFTILILNPLFALDCQYTQSVFDHTETIAVPYSVDNDHPIDLITFTLTGTEKAPLYFFNENDFNVTIQYDLTYSRPTSCFSGQCTKTVTENFIRIIESGSNEIPFNYSYGRYISISNLSYRENEFVYLKNKEQKIYKEICKLCGDVNCLDDGQQCSQNSECGGEFCIRRLCTTGIPCYNNDCNCSADEIQFENRTCIKKGSVAIGGTPQTSNPEECVTNYISPVTGNCAVALGDSCIQKNDCAENYCVLGACSDNDTNCYRNNCNCSSDQIQFNNKQCDSKYTVINGNRPPVANPDYCISRYIDPNTGLCAMTPDQKLELELKNQKEHRNFILILIICFIIFVVAFVVYNIYVDKKGKSLIGKLKDLIAGEIDIDIIGEKVEKKIKKLENDMDKLKENIAKSKNLKLDLENTLKDINRKINATHNDKARLARLLTEKENIIIKIEDKDHEIIQQNMQLEADQKKYDDLIKEGEKPENIVRFDPVVGREVIKIAHLGGYECFYKKGKEINEYKKGDLVHLSVWKQAHRRYPKFGYDIHHKDFNKYNNRADNLVEISKQEHRRLHNERYKSI